MHAGLNGEPRPLREQPCMQARRLSVRYGPACARQGGVNACMPGNYAEQHPPDVGRVCMNACHAWLPNACMHVCRYARMQACPEGHEPAGAGSNGWNSGVAS